MATSNIVLKSNTLPGQDGGYIEISEDAWPDVAFRPYLKKVEVEVEDFALAPRTFSICAVSFRSNGHV